MGLGCKRTTDVARAAHFGALLEARPRIQATIHDAKSAGLLVDDLLLDRLNLLIETGSATFTETLDDSDQNKQPL